MAMLNNQRVIVQKNGNGQKRLETVENRRKHDQAKTCPTKNKHFRATPIFFEGPKVSKGAQGETIGNNRRSHLR